MRVAAKQIAATAGVGGTLALCLSYQLKHTEMNKIRHLGIHLGCHSCELQHLIPSKIIDHEVMEPVPQGPYLHSANRTRICTRYPRSEEHVMAAISYTVGVTP